MSQSTKGRGLISAVFLGAAIATAAVSQSRPVSTPPDPRAQSAYEILNRRCYTCHGANGNAMKNIFVLDRERLVASRAVVPGDAGSLLLRMVESGAMPMGGPELPQSEKAVLRGWVTGGAPDWRAPQTDVDGRRRLSEAAIRALIRNDLLSAPERGRPFFRYFSLAHLYNAGVPDAELETYRAALNKLVNSLSWRRETAAPTAIDAAKTVYRIDLRDYDWTAATWTEILSAYPYALRTADSQAINQISGSGLPYIRADWFAANASVPPLYHDILRLPRTVPELERLLGVDASRDLEEEKNVARAGLRSSGVSQNNRVLERHGTASGAYWKSFDFNSSADNKNIFQDPIQFSPSGGEIIFNLPNGMQAYLLADSLGRRLDEAPIAIVSDRNNPADPVIRNGRSCMSCHYAGLQGFQDDLRPIISRMAVGSFDRGKALALYRPQQALDRLIETDSNRFQEALRQAGIPLAPNAQAEPINALSHRFLADLPESEAAAETGLEETEFRARVRRSARLISLGYGQLFVPGGAMKREVWETHFGDIASELQLGDYRPATAILLNRAGLPAAPAFGPAQARTSLTKARGIISADPNEILRSARSIVVMSRTVYLKPDQLETELSKLPGFKEAGLVFVRDARAADLKIELDRPVFTYTFTFAVTATETSVLAMSGKVTAFDGNFAAPKIAREIMKRIGGARAR